MKKEPFFIVGCPRSGTTLLQVLLDAHPNIAIPPESHIFVRFSNIFAKYGDLYKESNLRLLLRDLLDDHRIKDWGLEISVSELRVRLDRISLRRIISLLFELYAEKEGKIRWGDKTPQHALYLRKIKELFPEAKFIHLVRDGRDVAVSSSKIFVGPPSIYGIANEWRKYVLSFHNFNKTLSRNDFLEVHYEELVRNPENELCGIFHFLGEPVPSISRMLPNTSRKEHYLQRDLHMRSLQSSISDNKIGSFKKILSRREIEIFESIAGSALKLYGYSLLTEGTAIVSLNEKVRSFMLDHIYRYKRKYFRPSSTKEVSKLLRLEAQFYIRMFLRSVRINRTTD